MAKVQKKVAVHYSCSQMYELVSDIESYPDFISSCAEGVIERHEPDNSAVVARLCFEKSQFKQSFTTRNTLTPHQSIEMQLVDGPFSHLHGFWTFTPTSSGCVVGIELEFEFNNRLYKMMFSGIFQKLMSDLLGKFTNRADELYGSN
jgi:ribosome-associated toxin RatA of RatAB toxin-antitoxin module